jgi:osmotically-inducible protein OsmY
MGAIVMPLGETGRPGHTDPKMDDYVVERDFERRYGRRLGAAEREERSLREGRFTEERSWLARTGDEIASWFGNRDALRRRQWDEAAGDHSGVGPKAERSPDDVILDDVNQRLTNDANLDASGIEVTVLNGEVTLNGSVPIRADQRLAQDLIETVPGITAVHNNLRIGAGDLPG